MIAPNPDFCPVPKHTITFATFFYNRAAELDVTVQSMIAASVPGTRIVVVDDGSTDDTAERLSKYAGSVEVMVQKNKGFTQSVVDLLQVADSEFVAICGSGDICHPERLKAQLEQLVSDPGLVFCGTASRNLDARTGRVIDTQVFAEGELRDLDFMDSPPFTHGSVMFRMDAFRAVGGYDARFKFSQDWDLWLRMLSVGRGYFLNRFLYDRRVLADGASFNAQKAEEQLLYKHAALHLHRAGQVGRDEFLLAVQHEKSGALPPALRHEIRRDLSTRYIKLILGGHAGEASKARTILLERHGGVEFPLGPVGGMLALAGKAGMNFQVLGRLARWAISIYRRTRKVVSE